jgi:hypothetical protein
MNEQIVQYLKGMIDICVKTVCRNNRTAYEMK